MKRLFYISAVILAVFSLSISSSFAQAKKKIISPPPSKPKVSEAEIAKGKGLIATDAKTMEIYILSL